MRQVFRTSVIAAALLIFAVGSAEAGGKKGKRGMKGYERGDRVEMMIRHLDLTPEQIETVKKLKEERRQDAKPLVDKERALKKQIRGEWRSEYPDEDKLIKLHKKAARLRAKLGELRIEYRIDVLNTLDADQRSKLKEFRKARREKGERQGRGFEKKAERGDEAFRPGRDGKKRTASRRGDRPARGVL